MTEVLYLLHFEDARHHAQHYLGSTGKLTQRLTSHANGHGARITRVLADSEQHWVLAAVYARKSQYGASIKTLERKAKNRHNGRALCPICHKTPSIPEGTIRWEYVPNISSRELRNAKTQRSVLHGRTQDG